MQRQPLLEALRLVNVKYWWGFFFCITGTRNGKTATLRTKYDLQHFLKLLELPSVDFPDWRLDSPQSPLQCPERWLQVMARGRRKNHSDKDKFS